MSASKKWELKTERGDLYKRLSQEIINDLWNHEIERTNVLFRDFLDVMGREFPELIPQDAVFISIKFIHMAYSADPDTRNLIRQMAEDMLKW